MSSVDPEYNIDTSPTTPYNTPPTLIAFTLGVLVLCFVAFTIIYLCKFCFSSVIYTWAFQGTAPSSLIRLSPERSPPSGLDPWLMQLFPTFLYASVKDRRKDKYNLECAICLQEFKDDSMLRLLTLCCHVFHQECIDLWLCSHKTCPVCRTDLDTPTKSNDEIRIHVREEEEGDGRGASSVGEQRLECEHDHGNVVSKSTCLQQEEDEEEEQMFVRSHSTGHSIVLIRGEGGENKDADKYTLKLPGHVIKGRHNYTRSCASYNEMKKFARPCSNCGFVQPVSSCSPLRHAPNLASVSF